MLIKKRVVKENTKGLFLVVGDPKVPVTESSAQYMLVDNQVGN